MSNDKDNPASRPSRSADNLQHLDDTQKELLAYFAEISRLQTAPLPLLMHCKPGAAKTSLQHAVCTLIPQKSVNQWPNNREPNERS